MTDIIENPKRKHTKKSTYADGRIFKLIDKTNNNIYISGTIRDLCTRLANYKQKYKTYIKNKTNKYLIEFEILKNNDYSIELVEMCPCKNKDELNKHIYRHIKLIDCINKDREIIKIVNDINYSNEFDKIFSTMTSSINQKNPKELTREEMIEILMKSGVDDGTIISTSIIHQVLKADDQPIDI
jgi:competence CoiA-like predicted nuclease